MLTQYCVPPSQFIRATLVTLCLLTSSTLVQAADFRVATPAELDSARKSARPGDVITLVGKDWHDVRHVQDSLSELFEKVGVSSKV